MFLLKKVHVKNLFQLAQTLRFFGNKGYSLKKGIINKQ